MRSRHYNKDIDTKNVCTCIDFQRNSLPCKHIIAVQLYRTNKVAEAVIATKIEALNKIGVEVATAK